MLKLIKFFFKKILRVEKSYVSGKVHIHETVKILDSSIIGEVSINENSTIYKSSLKGQIKIGKNTSVNGPNTSLLSRINAISIGNFSSIAQNVLIQEYNHRTTSLSTSFINKNFFGESMMKDIVSKGNIEIGSDVWVGAGCVILSGVKIGNGAIVAANSTVTRDVPEFAVVGGTPAKIIKYRFDLDIIDILKNIQWWNWSDDKIKRNKAIFQEENINASILLKTINQN